MKWSNHIWDNTVQITQDEIRVGIMLNEGQLLYFEWFAVGRDPRNRRIWKTIIYPGAWDWNNIKNRYQYGG